jgi:release factor glutamine methyltransferase
VTTAYTGIRESDTFEVYPPQEDSHLLIDAMVTAGLAPGARVADLCTGSGVVAVAAAQAGAADVTAFDICPTAVTRARRTASAAGVDVTVHRGSWARAVEFAPFDLVLANPPYVPQESPDAIETIAASAGPAQAWNAGPDGRMVLDPLCAAAPRLLADGGTMLVVHSECSGVDQTLTALQSQGMRAEVVAEQRIPFGPVMTARAEWLMSVGLLEPGCNLERIVVVRADAR